MSPASQTSFNDSTMLPSPPSQMEAEFYYAGLPSRPKLVARTSTTPWEASTAPGPDAVGKEIRTVGNHTLREVWADDIAPKVLALLDEMGVKWTSVDVVRIGSEGECYPPVILWIGVLPGSLSGGDGVVAALRCRKLLEENDITDVEVEIRESVVTRWGTINIPG